MNRLGRRICIGMGALLLAGCAISPSGPPVSIATDTPSPPPLLSAAYSTKHPGPGCDPLHLAHTWSVGTTHPGHGGDVKDANTKVQCRSDGTLVTRLDRDVYDAVVWLSNPGGEPLPDDYRFQVTGRVVSGPDDSAVVLTINDQSNYGDEAMEVFPDGQWQIYAVDDQTDKAQPSVASGTLDPIPLTVTLQAEVHSSEMSFSISGQHLATVQAPHYDQTHSVGFAIDDPHPSPTSALFSDFSYTPL